MRFRTLLVAVTLVLTGLVGAPTVASAAPADATSSSVTVQAARTCTKTSNNTCIKGGQFCPKASYGKSGYDINHRRWVCKGDRNHPKWTKP